MTIKISDFYPHLPDCGKDMGELGIYTLQGSVFVNYGYSNVKDYDVDYHAKFAVFDSKLALGARLKKRESTPCEVFEFYFRANLNDYIISYEKDFLGKPHKITEVDKERLVKDFAFELYQYHCKRLERKILSTPVSPKPFENGEFLSTHVGDGDNNNWCGDYEHNGEFGCCATISKSEVHPEGLSSLLNLTNMMYDFDDISTVQKFKDSSIDVQLETLKKLLGRCSDVELQSEVYFPYRLHLSGNDDYSMSKRFMTKDECDKELEYLRMMQPLDMTMDIHNRGYFFTN